MSEFPSLDSIAIADRYVEELAATRAAMERKREFNTNDICKLPQEIRVVLKPERKQRQALKRRSPSQWRSVIRREIRNTGLRCRVACIVWWDYFADRSIAERWNHLDAYLDSPVCPCAVEDMRRALYSIGYTALQAHSRVQETYYQKNNGAKEHHATNN